MIYSGLPTVKLNGVMSFEKYLGSMRWGRLGNADG
jgi:hypothetical protein